MANLATNYYAISDNGELLLLGNHGDIEAAFETADSLAINAIWVFDQGVADEWQERLAHFKKTTLQE
jgi:hypothetical protein